MSSAATTLASATRGRRRLGSTVRFETAWLSSVAAVLLASGLGHAAYAFASGADWSGPLSLRKPVLFGLSAAATVASIAWVSGLVRRRRGDTLLLTCFGLAMLVEVSLITAQQWRGVASHFNRGTPLDAQVLWWIETLILFATVVIADITHRSFGKLLRADAPMRLAVRGGLLLLLLSCLIGIGLAAYGNQRVAAGLPPGQYGGAGVVKFPHGVPMHAIQVLPAAAWLLRRAGVSRRRRGRSVAWALAATVAFTGYSLLQTLAGRGRFDIQWMSSPGFALLARLGCAAAALLVAGRRADRSVDSRG